jgi:hypothetical protein
MDHLSLSGFISKLLKNAPACPAGAFLGSFRKIIFSATC